MTEFHPVLLDVWREACRHIEIDESADQIFNFVAEPLSLAALAVYRYDEARDDLHLATSVGAAHARYPGTIGAAQTRDQSIESWIGAPRFQTWNSVPWLAGAARMPRSEYGAPLTVDGSLVGLLAVRFTDPPIKDELTALLQRAETLVEPFSVAVVNDGRLREIHVLQQAAEAERSTLLQKLGMRQFKQDILGARTGLADVLERVRLVSRTDTPVLIFGETGTGKEVIAREIHNQSERQEAPFIRVNCGAIPPGLIDSELFGHERGSFTGAHKARAGWFERADGGTLFLDEVGELPSEAQVRLLRVLQDGHFERVGGHHEVGVDVRVVAATHRPLAEMVREGRFREDLWYRVAVFPIEIPPLRERKEDIPELARHFAERAARRFGLALQLPDSPGLAAMVAYDWPGNIRELAAVVDRAAILGNGHSLEVRTALGMTGGSSSGASMASEREPAYGFRPAPQGGTRDVPTVAPLEEAVRRHIANAVAAAGGKIEGSGGAAEMLRVNPSTLRSRMRKLGLL